MLFIFTYAGNLKTHMQRHAGTLPKRYGPGGQRRQTTSRLLQVGQAQTARVAVAAAASAAAAYAIAAAGTAPNNNERNLNSQTQQQQQQQQQSQQQNNQTNSSNSNSIRTPKYEPVSPNNADESRSPSSLMNVTSTASMNGTTSQRNLTQQQSVISNGIHFFVN